MWENFHFRAVIIGVCFNFQIFEHSIFFSLNSSIVRKSCVISVLWNLLRLVLCPNINIHTLSWLYAGSLSTEKSNEFYTCLTTWLIMYLQNKYSKNSVQNLCVPTVSFFVLSVTKRNRFRLWVLVKNKSLFGSINLLFVYFKILSLGTLNFVIYSFMIYPTLNLVKPYIFDTNVVLQSFWKAFL